MSIWTLTRRSMFAGILAVSAALASTTVLSSPGMSHELRVVQPWEIVSLEPEEAGFIFTRTGVMESLVAFGSDGKIEPGLASSWTVSDDGRTWRFQLRDATFHDGTPVNAAAVKTSLEYLLPKSLYLKGAGIETIDVDGNDVVIRLAKPFGPFLSYLVDYSIGVLAPSAFDKDGKVTAVIGTGPFAIESMDLPRGITLTRNDKYWGQKPQMERVLFDVVANGDTRSNIAAAADADIVFNLTAPGVARAEAAGMMVERVIIPRVHNVILNAGKPQFSDVRTRKALSMAIDRSGIAASVMRNPELAATQFMPPILPDWHFTDLPAHQQDIAAANALLDEAGWVPGSDGIRSKDGVRFAGTMRTFANRPELPVIATALQAQFKEIGFDLAIDVGDWQAIYEGQKDGSLDLALSSRNLAVVPDPIGSISQDYTSDTNSPGGAGATNWRNDAIRADVKQYMETSDEAQKRELRRRIAGVIHEELPVIPVVWYDQSSAVNPKLDGITHDPLSLRYFLERVQIKQ